MAIFQIKVNKLSKNQIKKMFGKTGKNLAYISRGTNSGRTQKSVNYIAREKEYKNRDDLIYYEEKNIPKEFKNGEEVAEYLEKTSRSNARLLKKYEGSLPLEFDDKKNIEIAKEFCEKQFGDKYIYFMGIHNPDGRHPHLHVSVVERKLNDGIERTKEQYFKTYNSKYPEKGGLQVDKDCEKREYFENFCRTWEETLNRHLVLNGHEKIKPKEETRKIFFSKKEIEKMTASETKEALLKLQDMQLKNKREIDKLYKNNFEKLAINKMTDGKLYKWENKIKNLTVIRFKKNISLEKKVSLNKQLKTLESAKDKLINDCKSNSEFDKIKAELKSERNQKIKSLRIKNESIDRNIEKIFSIKDKKTISRVKNNLEVSINNKANEYIDRESEKKLEEIYKKQQSREREEEKYKTFDREKNDRQNYESNEKKEEKTKVKDEPEKVKQDVKVLKNTIVTSSKILGTIKSLKSSVKSLTNSQNFGTIININKQKRYDRISKNRTEISAKDIREDMQKEKVRSR